MRSKTVLVKDRADNKHSKDIKKKVKPKQLTDTTREYLKKIGETDSHIKKYMSTEIKFEDGIKYIHPVDKKIKIEQTSDTITFYERNDYNTRAGESSRKQIRVEDLKSHGDVQYICDHCCYKATLKGALKTHIESVHEKVWYSCDQCAYKGTQ